MFTFPTRSAPAPQTAASEAVAEINETDVAEAETEVEDEGDELLLGADDILTSPVGAPPIEPPADEDETDAPAAASGTLFERMSNIARGAPKAQIEDEEPDYKRDPIDIPRFLNRQNNQ